MLEIIPEIILASKSKPRCELLEKFHIKFRVLPSNIDETPLPNEQPLDLVERLSKEKAKFVLNNILLDPRNTNLNAKNNYIIISSDQVAVVDNKIYGKPGNYENAVEQLQTFSGKELKFITGLFVLPYGEFITRGNKNGIYSYEVSTLKIKELHENQIINYLRKEQPYDCAASFKIEGLGISLVDSIITEDFNAIIGLPLLKLSKVLTKLNLDVLNI